MRRGAARTKQRRGGDVCYRALRVARRAARPQTPRSSRGGLSIPLRSVPLHFTTTHRSPPARRRGTRQPPEACRSRERRRRSRGPKRDQRAPCDRHAFFFWRCHRRAHNFTQERYFGQRAAAERAAVRVRVGHQQVDERVAARGVAASAGTSRITILYRCEPGGAQKKRLRRASASPRAHARAASAAPSAAARLAATWQFRSGGGALQLRASRACTDQRSREAAARRPRVTAIVPARQARQHAIDVIELGRRKQPPGGGQVRSFVGRRQWPSRGRRALCLLQIVRQHSRHRQSKAAAAEKEREGEERVSHALVEGEGDRGNKQQPATKNYTIKLLVGYQMMMMIMMM